MMPKVFIIDDDDALRDAISMLLGLHGLRTEKFTSAEEFLEAFSPDQTGCVLLDLKMPGMGGLELQRELRARGANLPIVIVTAHADVPAVRSALLAGAFNFLEKPVENETLLEVIGNALAHARRQREAIAAVQQRKGRLDRLTTRERQVMNLLAEGKSHREIAAELGISPRTVEVYKARLMDKVQAHSLADIVRFAAAAQQDDPG